MRNSLPVALTEQISIVFHFEIISFLNRQLQMPFPLYVIYCIHLYIIHCIHMCEGE